MYSFNGLEVNSQERKNRDLHLRNVALGKEKGELTGYAGTDKPWLKYYSEEAICCDFEPMSIYQLMKKCTAGYDRYTAISYYGNKITYKEQSEQIDRVASALANMSIKPGDNVIMSLPAVPEAQFLFYAINKIGAVVYSVDPRVSKEELATDIVFSHAKAFFAIDVMLPKLNMVKEIKDVPNVIAISPYESMPLFLKTLLKLKTPKAQADFSFIRWNDFMKKGNEEKSPAYYEPDQCAVIIHTGGSTGTSKGVQLSNENCNALIYQNMTRGFDFKPGKTFLNIAPPFIALGLLDSYHNAACQGFEMILVPTFEAQDFPKLLKKHKPDIVMAGPIYYRYMIESIITKEMDFSFLDICMAGGDKLSVDLQHQIQVFFDTHNAKAKICVGYGATETSSASSCVINESFRFESVGVPFLNETFELFDPDTGEKVKGYGNIGELWVSGPTTMIGYYGQNAGETEEVLKRDAEGNLWYKTGDLAHFDEDGFVYIDGRIKRIIVRRGWKIYPNQIEEIINRHPAVKECAVVPAPDPADLHVPVAYIVLNEDGEKEKVVSFATETIMAELPEYTKIEKFYFVEALPLTPIGKVDFKELEKRAGSKSVYEKY